MILRHILFIIVLLAAPLAYAQEGGTQDDASADSINRLARDEDFIRVSLLTATHGHLSPSVMGHSLLRMQCPSASLDVTFSYEALLADGEEWKYFTSHIEGRFRAAQTNNIIRRYANEGRGIIETPLRLAPLTEQHLWQLLDEELDRTHTWHETHYNCATAIYVVLNQALATAPADSLLPQAAPYAQRLEPSQPAPSSYIDIARRYIYPTHPWNALMWMVAIGWRTMPDDNLHPTLFPQRLHEMAQQLADGPDINLLQQRDPPQAPWLTPPRAALGIILLLLLIIYIRKRKRQ